MKIERLLSIIILLLTKDTISAATLAKKFEVTKRTIYRDMQTLEYAGFPIVAVSGKEGGYRLLDSYKLHTHTFTTQDKQRIIDALLMQEQLLAQVDNSSLITKKMDMISPIQSKIPELSFLSATLHNPIVEQETNRKLAIIRTVINKHQKLKISYVSNNANLTTRIIAPLTLKLLNGSWYVDAYCDMRKELRVFKVTRMQDIEVIAVVFDASNLVLDSHSTVAEQEITLQFTKQTLGKLYDFYPKERIQIYDSHILVTFTHPTNQNLIPFLLMFGNQVKVCKPNDLKQQHQKSIIAMQSIYAL